MTTNGTIQPGTVVVGYDGSDHAKLALRWAADEAAMESRPLTVLHVTDALAKYELSTLTGTWIPSDELREAVADFAGEVLSEAQESVSASHPDVEVELVAITGDPRSVLLDASKTAGSLFVGSRGRGQVASLLLGSVSVAVSRAAHCPTFVIRPHNEGRVRNGIIVGTDCSERTRATLEFAYRQASLRQLPLTVLHSVGPVEAFDRMGVFVEAIENTYEQERLELATSVAGLAEKFPEVRARLRVGQGVPDVCLLSEGEKMDLIVVGHHAGRRPGDMFGLGSFATSVVENAHSPVVVVAERREERG